MISKITCQWLIFYTMMVIFFETKPGFFDKNILKLLRNWFVTSHYHRVEWEDNYKNMEDVLTSSTFFSTFDGSLLIKRCFLSNDLVEIRDIDNNLFRRRDAFQCNNVIYDNDKNFYDQTNSIKNPRTYAYIFSARSLFYTKEIDYTYTWHEEKIVNKKISERKALRGDLQFAFMAAAQVGFFAYAVKTNLFGQK